MLFKIDMSVTAFALLVLVTTGSNSKLSLKARALSSTRLKRSAESTNIAQFQQYLEPILRSRVPGTDGHRKVKEFIIDFFKDIAWDVKLDEFSQPTVIGQRSFTNIIATANPNAKKVLLLTAHYDSKIMEKLSNGREFVAATDSAVPCAMMMSIAKNLDLEALKKNNDHTLQLVFFDGEEAFKQWSKDDSIYGSSHLAEIWSQSNNYDGKTYLQDVEALILLDLIGEKNLKFYSGFIETHPLFERLHRIETRLRVNNLIKSKSEFFVNKLLDRQLGVEDDHIPFLEKDVPILHLIPIPFPRCWHKMCDNKENIDMDTIHDLLKIFDIFFKEVMRL